MSERLPIILKVVCLALGGLMLYQAAPLLAGRDPLGHIRPPAQNLPLNNPHPPAKSGNPPIPADVTARVEQITQSEIFGPVPRPLPMGLIGIFGNEASVRAPNGQVGWMKEGDEFGGMKLIRIGTNRILIEHEEETKELTIFGGFGSESLKEKEKKAQ